MNTVGALGATIGQDGQDRSTAQRRGAALTFDTLLEKRVRTSADWRAASSTVLPAEIAARVRLAGTSRTSHIVLQSRRPGFPARLVSPDTARLVRDLRRPNVAASVIGTRAETAAVLATLVLDAIVEVEIEPACWITGAAVAAVLGVTTPRAVTGTRAGQQAAAALRHASALAYQGTARVARSLYAYNRAPFTPYMRTRLPALDQIVRYARDASSWHPNVLSSGWRAHPAGVRDMWARWSAPETRVRSGARTWKLYVSPACDAVGDTIPVAARVAADSAACSFKIGRPPRGLLRPDKIVLYFASVDDLHTTANDLRRELHGVPAHGVPFAAALTADGLLSWGIDPPTDAAFAVAGGALSWRVWVTNHLAAFLVIGAATGRDAMRPEEFAQCRLTQEYGVDTATWTPPPTLWATP